LNPSDFSLGDAALTKAVANPFYGIANIGVGSLASKTVSAEQLLLPFPQYTSVSSATTMRAERFTTPLTFAVSGSWRKV